MKAKSKPKNAAAMALAEISRRSRMKNLTAAQRSEQGRKAVASRRDRQKGPWFVLLVYPKDYLRRGVVHAVAEMIAHPRVEFWSQDKAEVVAKSQEPQ